MGEFDMVVHRLREGLILYDLADIEETEWIEDLEANKVTIKMTFAVGRRPYLEAIRAHGDRPILGGPDA